MSRGRTHFLIFHVFPPSSYVPVFVFSPNYTHSVDTVTWPDSLPALDFTLGTFFHVSSWLLWNGCTSSTEWQLRVWGCPVPVLGHRGHRGPLAIIRPIRLDVIVADTYERLSGDCLSEDEVNQQLLPCWSCAQPVRARAWTVGTY